VKCVGLRRFALGELARDTIVSDVGSPAGQPLVGAEDGNDLLGEVQEVAVAIPKLDVSDPPPL
jgi:hypothetical protein